MSLAAIQLCDQYIIMRQLFRKRNKRGRKNILMHYLLYVIFILKEMSHGCHATRKS